MLIAVTTSNGIDVDTHFGKARRFLIFDMASGEPTLLRDVQAPSYCDWNASLQDMSPDQAAAALDTMRECAGAPPAHRMMPDKLAAISQAGCYDCQLVRHQAVAGPGAAAVGWSLHLIP